MARKNLRSNSSPKETMSSSTYKAPPKTLNLPLFQEKNLANCSSNSSSRLIGAREAAASRKRPTRVHQRLMYLQRSANSLSVLSLVKRKKRRSSKSKFD